MKNTFQKSTYGTMYYIIKNDICYFSLRRRGLEETLAKVTEYNLGRSIKPASIFDGRVFVDSLIEKDEDLLHYFLMTYFSSNEFKRDKYFSHNFNSEKEGDLEILADILVCVDKNKADTTSSISADPDGVRTSLLIFEKKKGLARIFGDSNAGKFSATLPLSNANAFVAENTSVTFRMRDGRLYCYGNQSTVTKENFDTIYKNNLVDFYG